tara:strand:+ start:161 stop:427 length:267 start_codon:yes stop_codon:yes gene_type:complete
MLSLKSMNQLKHLKLSIYNNYEKPLPFLFVVSNLCQSQVLHREMLSASGTTSKSSNGDTVTQTLAQSSIIGNYSSALFLVSQGFRQSN